MKALISFIKKLIRPKVYTTSFNCTTFLINGKDMAIDWDNIKTIKDVKIILMAITEYFHQMSKEEASILTSRLLYDGSTLHPRDIE